MWDDVRDCQRRDGFETCFAPVGCRLTSSLAKRENHLFHVPLLPASVQNAQSKFFILFVPQPPQMPLLQLSQSPKDALLLSHHQSPITTSDTAQPAHLMLLAPYLIRLAQGTDRALLPPCHCSKFNAICSYLLIKERHLQSLNPTCFLRLFP